MASKHYNPDKVGNLGCNRTNNEELRIVLVGKTGNGKSATGNTILGQLGFEAKLRATSVTVDCAKVKAVVDGQQVAVIDTPGLFDTRVGKSETAKNLCQCTTYAAPGPHVFLVVIGVGRYTEEEKETVRKIQEMFGQEVDKYSMVLFTRGDELGDTTIEDFLSGSEDLQELVARCDGMYHVFNNKTGNSSQVIVLLQKIRDLVQKNGGSHYTNEMFQEVERANEEEKQRILKENEEKRRKEREELEREIQEKYEKIIKKVTEEFQAERERERKEKEEERKRDRQEMNEERQREKQGMKEERQREKQGMKEERQREKQEMKEERQREKQEMKEERQREKQEMNEERQREKQEVKKERQREKQEMKEERQRERQEMKEERQREAERERKFINMKLNEIKEQLNRELRQRDEMLLSLHEKEAREKAEKSNSGYYLAKTVELLDKGMIYADLARNIISLFRSP